MEININDFTTDNTDPTGTSLQGYLTVSYADLVKKLGKPTNDFVVVTTLPIVVQALQACGVEEIHERILDMLNLMVVDLYPKYVIDTHATNLASSWGQWASCVTQYIVDSK